jgi:hypothetical protein
MSITVSGIAPAAVDEVFAWHERRGALTRLAPPWQPVRVRSEAADLRAGTAELALPGGITWKARHSDYEPERQFADELTSLPLRWRHEHRFSALSATTTRVVDHVDTPVPARLLRSMFAYRHRQLAADLIAHQAFGPAPLTVAITGGSGMVGTALAAFLSTGGHRVIRLVRGTPAGPDERQWRPDDPDPELLAGVDAVVHLAGASIGGRLTGQRKRNAYDSRVAPTRRLAELAATSGLPVFVTASAIGFYGFDRGDEVIDESAGRGDGFLADLVTDWEAATGPAEKAGCRVVRVRTGIVLSPRGGVLRLLYPLYVAGLGGPLGDGMHWMSWIGLDDLLDVYLHALVEPELAGPVNAVAPEPLRYRDFSRVLGRVLHRPAILPVPAFGPRLLLGADGARELAFASQRVRPARLRAAKHTFRTPELADALAHVLGRSGDFQPRERA